MFNNLLSFWKGKDFLNKVLGEFEEMLDDAEKMFKSVCDKLLEGKEEPGLKERIYEIDKEVNEFEKAIRKRLVEHLSIQPSTDVAFCLVLMSVVKDAERLGDYAKNLHEVTEILGKPIDKELFNRYFNQIDKKLLDEFAKTKTAFANSSEEAARESLDLEREIVKKCDRIISELAQSDLPVKEGVALVLVARYFKRTAAHLANIGSSVILPISDLDFFDEKMRHK